MDAHAEILGLRILRTLATSAEASLDLTSIAEMMGEPEAGLREPATELAGRGLVRIHKGSTEMSWTLEMTQQGRRLAD
jgi:DNA-binding IscR family transcriptional regulator